MHVLSLLVPPLCVACRGPSRRGHPLCARCARELEFLDRRPVQLAGLRVWAPLAYEGPARAMVRRLKFHGAVALADQMAAAIVANAPAALLDRPLVPVPSPRARARRRGFCHARLLAVALARRTGLPVADLLERAGEARQVGRARSERLRAPPRFQALQEGDSAVLVVDDVFTTGATVGACARALRANGWRCASAVAYARTPVR